MHDGYQLYNDIYMAADQINDVQGDEHPNNDAQKFLDRIKEAEALLYTGSTKFTWMVFVLELYYLKYIFRGSNSCLMYIFSFLR